METSKNTYVSKVDSFEPITRIDFNVYTNKNILEESVFKDPNGITTAEIYSGGEPVEGGVSDKRLGVIEGECATCKEKAADCPGHFGHIKFIEPVFHMGLLTFLKTILSCVCIKCHKLLVYKNENEIARLIKNKQNKQRFLEIRNLLKTVTHCQKNGCGTPAHHIYIDKKNANVFLLAEPIKRSGDIEEGNDQKKRTPQILTPQFCYDLLRLISNEDCMIMGLDPNKTRPEDMIIINFPVPPIAVRPSIKMDIGASSTIDDDLTHKLVEIIKNHESLKKSKGDGSLSKTSNVDDDFMLLQFHVATFFDNNTLGLPKSQQKNKKTTKSMSERLKGKEGRVRGNLTGKRVDFSGRTVITSDPLIPLNGLGVPMMMAMNLTFQEVVTKYNIKYLTQLVRNGPRVYPGANTIIKKEINSEGEEVKKMIYLRHTKKIPKLEIGYVVERHLVDGDFVIFNRQPTLHKMSMMGHIISIIEDPQYLTLRVNVNVTDPYNADFDGDEMNIHVPQSLQTTVEIRLIANAANRFISGATGKIAINAKQDTVMGSYLQTYDTTQIDWKDVMNIMMMTSIGLNGAIPKNKQISGKYMYSQILPKEINIVTKKDNGEYYMRILNGMVTHGVYGKSEISFILQKIWFQYGSKITTNFIDDCQRMVLFWLMRYGFTMSIKDMVVPEKINKCVREIIETKRKEIFNMLTEYENDPEIISSEAFEAMQLNSHKSIQGEIEQVIMNSFKTDAGIYIAISSGSSGSIMNPGQIIGCIGQIIVESKRIQKKFNNRTLPMFYQHDDSSFARGFCYSSFIKGLSPSEFFFHVMAGREGNINTAIKTADTGYIQRRLVKILEDIKVEYDGTVRNANDKLIQCVYGDNGINTEKQIEQKINLIVSNNTTVRENYLYTVDEINDMRKKFKINEKYTADLNEQLYKKLIAMRDHVRQIQKNSNISTVAFRDVYRMPVDLQQYVINIVSRTNRQNTKIVDPYYVLTKIKDMYSGSYSKIMKYNDKKFSVKKEDEHRIKFLLKFYLYDTLAPKKCTHVNKFSQTEFDELVEYFRKTIMLAKVEAGEMVGIVAAQSIGEPVSQANLKSFHKSGTGKTVSLGLPRVKEILSASRKISTPITTIILDEKYKNDKVIANKIASHLKYTTLLDVVDSVDIYYDPNPLGPDSVMTKDKVNNIFEVSQGKSGCQNEIAGLPWILRLSLSKEKMIERNVTMIEIKTSFCYNWSTRYDTTKGAKKEYKKVLDKVSQCAIISNYDNSPVPIIHIRFDANNYNFNTLVQFQEMVINKYKIKGISGIDESNNIELKKYIDFDTDGNIVRREQYIITTEGINLTEMAQINGINIADSVCNDIMVIYETYGIEAARATYIRELSMAIEDAGVSVNYQHIELLADAVTHMGGIIAVNRHGANKLDTDPFSRASFERTVEQMLSAAVFGESDHMRSVSARIMAGTMIKGGTGCFDILLDHVKVKQTLIPKIDGSKDKNIQQIVKRSSVVSDLIKKKK